MYTNTKKAWEADRDYLQPLYDYINSRIRAIDENHIIFYEQSLIDEPASISGFTDVPGGVEFRNRSVFSYHVYCLLQYQNGEARYNFLVSIIIIMH